jgi:hypothetical protein
VRYYYSAGRFSHIARRVNAAELFISSFAAGAHSKLASFAERHGAFYLWSEEILYEGAQNAAEITLNDHLRRARTHIICLRAPA